MAAHFSEINFLSILMLGFYFSVSRVINPLCFYIKRVFGVRLLIREDSNTDGNICGFKKITFFGV